MGWLLVVRVQGSGFRDAQRSALRIPQSEFPIRVLATSLGSQLRGKYSSILSCRLITLLDHCRVKCNHVGKHTLEFRSIRSPFSAQKSVVSCNEPRTTDKGQIKFRNPQSRIRILSTSLGSQLRGKYSSIFSRRLPALFDHGRV